jgi:hypothetical protein
METQVSKYLKFPERGKFAPPKTRFSRTDAGIKVSISEGQMLTSTIIPEDLFKDALRGVISKYLSKVEYMPEAEYADHLTEAEFRDLLSEAEVKEMLTDSVFEACFLEQEVHTT